jgi:hypothetical protein
MGRALDRGGGGSASGVAHIRLITGACLSWVMLLGATDLALTILSLSALLTPPVRQ